MIYTFRGIFHMQNSKKCGALLFLCILPFVSGCGKSLRYNPKLLPSLTIATSNSYQIHRDVTVLAKVFDAYDCEYYFNNAHLQIIPIQITVNNESDSDWIFSPEYMNLCLADYQTITEEISPSIARAIGMFFIPLVPFNIIAGGIYTYHQFKTKERIAGDISQKAFQQGILIPAGKRRSTVLFVKKDQWKPHLILDLINAKEPRDKLTYELSLL